MKVLVLGVSGHVGNAIARALLDHGHQVTGVNRSRRRAFNLKNLAIRRLIGDIPTAPLDRWMRGHDLVIDAAAPYPLALSSSSADTARLVEAATRRTHALLRAAQRQSIPLIYISSFVTLGQLRYGLDRVLSQVIRWLHPYFAVKTRIEQLLIAARRRRQDLAIVNLTGCLGPWDCKAPARCFVPALLNGKLPASTDQMLNVIDVRDVALNLIGLLNADLPPAPLALVGHNISNDMLFRWICEIGGAKPPPLVTPTAAGILATYFTEAAATRLGLAPPLPALIAMLTYLHGFMTPSPSQIDLGIKLRPLSATLDDTVRWYRSIGYC
ncbi:MAG TPA: NAD-dependent epimerase/dehydratase family protein [Candidatus Binataceae bacterium]|nr:NAD-dependent epimerase/dehydratase family protein [Candidatus Binataceae bacterium]